MYVFFFTSISLNMYLVYSQDSNVKKMASSMSLRKNEWKFLAMRTNFSNPVEVAGIHTAKASKGLKLLKGRALIVKGRSHPTF